MSQHPPNLYHLMLGLPAAAGEPDHYELLGLNRFEDDRERIHTAAIDRNRQLLNWQNSQYHDEADQLIGDVVVARDVLLDPQRKASYDRQLGRNTNNGQIVTSVAQGPRRVGLPESGQPVPAPEEVDRQSSSESEPNFYHLMLGLPAAVSAPDHYELLGVPRFEGDHERIHTAAIDRNRQLLQWQNSQFHVNADRLISEVAAAHDVLVDPERKAAYDRQLGRNRAAMPADQMLSRTEFRAPIFPEGSPQSLPMQGPFDDFSAPSTLERRIRARGTRRSGWAAIDLRWRMAASAMMIGAILIGSWRFFGTREKVKKTERVLKVATAKVAAVAPSSGPRPSSMQSSPKSMPAELVAPLTAAEARTGQQAWAKYLGKKSAVERNSIGLDLVLIPPGTFLMGDKPVEVTLTQPFYLGKTELTQGQWQAVMHTTPWKGQENAKEDMHCPAFYVSWDDAQEFCRRLGETEGVTYRLPTEAEWEHACRAGTTAPYSFGGSGTELSDYAWWSGNSRRDNVQEPYAHRVGLKKANAWGLCDMHGNVWEWCADWYHDSPVGGPDPTGPSDGSDRMYLSGIGYYTRVFRGGSWYESSCGSTSRNRHVPGYRNDYLGFRVVRVMPRPAQSPSVQPSPEPASAGAGQVSLTAPFTAAEAQSAQQTWARSLGMTSPVERNSIGMELVLIPPGRFMMGSADSDVEAAFEEKPQMEVTLTQPFYAGRTEVTQSHWRAVMRSTPWSGTRLIQEAPGCPATNISWDDAQAFCKRLGEMDGKTYRLLTEAEWEYACRAGSTTKYQFGDTSTVLESYAWINDNTGAMGELYSHATGRKRANAFGLCDMHGNAWEWCGDWYGEQLPGGINPTGPPQGTLRSLRGGGWFNSARDCRSAIRNGNAPSYQSYGLGFRVAAVPSGLVSVPPQALTAAIPSPAPNSTPAVTPVTLAFQGKAPASLRAPFTAGQALAAQQEWARALGETGHVERNSIGMDLVLIPPGVFLMGAPVNDNEAGLDEKPQVYVTLTQPIYAGKTEVTQGQWQSVMNITPWRGQADVREGPNHAASHINWTDAQQFCERLGLKEGRTYRLLTEAEWEYACRAGTTTKYHFGDDRVEVERYAWFDDRNYSRGEQHPHVVALEQANAFGLHDMHGNAWEWCADWQHKLAGGRDPVGPSQGGLRTIRGGSGLVHAGAGQSSSRYWNPPSVRGSYFGFRVALVPASVAPPPAPQPPAPSAPPASQSTSARVLPAVLPAPFTAARAHVAQRMWARALGKTGPVERNSVGLELILIPPGTFMMGEKQDVKVTLTRPLYIGKTEVTQGQWEAVMRTSPWTGQRGVKEGPDFPATYVNWDHAQEFCKRLGEKEGGEYRLPTEAEWEFACRAGTTTKYQTGENESTLDASTWFGSNASSAGEGFAHEVGRKQANPFGLHDMLGNVDEWCLDWHDSQLTGGSDPTGPPQGAGRVGRGGTYYDVATNCSSASRCRRDPAQQREYLGFRVALVPPNLNSAPAPASSTPSP